MALSSLSIKKTLLNEGGFQKDPNDHANWSSGQIGVGTLIGTKYGITALDLPGKDIENLSEDDAIEYYEKNYWKPLYSQISSQEIADKLFDCGVLFGVGEAILLLQHVLKTGFPEIEPDGIFGPSTLGAVEQADDTSLLNAYKSALVAHALQIVVKKPEEKKFVAGWGTRINS